ncbi:MAG: DHA2 family efflux MFS transporter permease subunit [Candidatus Methylomirabilota bacterium]
MNAGDGPTSSTHDRASEWRPRFNPWLIALAVMPATFMEVLDTSVANVALPHIAGSLSATPEEATWVLTSYLVSNAIILPAAAWLGAIFGRKRLLLTCIVLFTLASALCGAAPSLGLLVLARVLQGVGGGALQPIAQAVLLESFPPARRGVAMATYGIGVVVAPILGPTLGGWITENYTWRWIFYLNLPVGLVAILMAEAFIEDPPYIRRSGWGRIDYFGFGLMAIGLATLQVMLDRGQEDDWFSAVWVRWFAVISVVSLIAFIIRELRAEHPIVDLRILRNRNFAVGTLLITILGMVLYSMVAMLPLFLQILMGYSALLSGLAITPRGLGALFMNIIAGRLIGFLDGRLLIAVGFALVAGSGFVFSQMNLQIAMSNVVWVNVLNGIGTAMIFVSLATMTMGTLRNEQMGNATGIFNLMRNIGGSIGIAGMATFLDRWAQSHQAILVSHLTPYDPAYRQWLSTAQAGLKTQVGGVAAGPKALGLLYNVLGQQARLLAYMDNFRVISYLSLLAVPLVLLFKKAKGRPAPPAD